MSNNGGSALSHGDMGRGVLVQDEGGSTFKVGLIPELVGGDSRGSPLQWLLAEERRLGACLVKYCGLAKSVLLSVI